MGHVARALVRVLMFGAFAAQTATAQALPPRSLELAAVLEAARANVEVSLARRLQEAARADVRAADRAPTPVLSAKAAAIDLDHGVGGGSLIERKRIDKGLGLDWVLERGQKRALRTASAREMAEAAGMDVQDVAVRQQVEAAAAFYELLAAQERLAHLEAMAAGAEELSRAAQRRLRAGDIAQQEALRTEIEAERGLAERRAAQTLRERAALALVQLTGLAGPLSAAASWPLPATEVAPLPDVESRPDVRAARRRVEASRAALDAALALRRNDVTVGASMSHQPGTSRALMELRLQMPLAGMLGNYGYEGEIARAQAQLAQAEDVLDRTRRLAIAEGTRLAEELNSAAVRAARFEADIVPRARRVAEMAELAYGRGALALVDLIDARRTLRTVLLDQTAARVEHARALATWQLRTSS